MADGDEPGGLGERPEADKLQRAVARSRVAGALFAKPPEQVKLGRYHLLEQVGAGGMGVVWGAWDPELDRRVAIKLVKANTSTTRERILAEGQALAKLSHPNVIPVYDVGVVDEQVYLVMEWVRGQNLRAWTNGEPRTVRAIVDAYRAAGEGLAAAHRAGLVHRDFKPDNAMIGDDGRVRVLDFGLARGEVRASDDDSVDRPSDLTRGAGTPRYMAPEQAEGKALTPAADQYAFGVSLRESLGTAVPRWLDTIITRTTAREAAHRFPSMDDVVRALGRDPATIWRRRALAAGALGLAGAAFVVGSLQSDEPDACAGAADEIAKVWNPALAQRITRHLASLGAYGADEAKRLVPDLDAYSRRWAATHQRVCQANERKELGPQLYDVRLACLARAEVALQTVADVLGRSDAQRLPNAVTAARSLVDVDACATETQLATIEPPPVAIKAQVDELAEQLEKLRFLALAHDPSAVGLGGDLATRAEKLGYGPLIGRALLAQGFAIIGDGKGARDAVPILSRARSASLRAGDAITAIEAYAREVYASWLGGSKTLDVTATRSIFEDLAHSTRTQGTFARALLFNNLGTERMSVGDPVGAAVWFDRARMAHGDASSVELFVASGNLAMVTEDAAKRHALFAEEQANLTRVLGVNHPLTIQMRLRSAQYIDHPDEADAVMRDACTAFATWHRDVQRSLDVCGYERGLLAAERNDIDAMRGLFASIREQPNYRKIGAAYTAIADGKPAEAIAAMDALATAHAEKHGWWQRMLATDALVVVARGHVELGDRARATAALRRALAILDGTGFNKIASYYERRRARIQAALARLGITHGLAEAIAWYRQAGGYDKVVAELEQLTGSR